LRLKEKDSKMVTSQKIGDVALSSIAVDGSNSDGQSSNANKSPNDHVEKMVDLSKIARGSLSSSMAGASNSNTAVNVGISEGSADTGLGACPRSQTKQRNTLFLFDRCTETLLFSSEESIYISK